MTKLNNKLKLPNTDKVGIELMDAIYYKDLNKVKSIDMFKLDLDGSNGLYAALDIAMGKGISFVKAILNSHLDVNHVHPKDNITPLMSAVVLGKLDIVKALVEKGADANQFSDRNGTSTPFIRSAIPTTNDILAYFIGRGFDLDVAGKSGDTALMTAVNTDSYSAAKMLLEAGADHTIKNKQGDTAYSAAVKNNSFETKKLLDAHIKKIASATENEALINATLSIEDNNVITGMESTVKSPRTRI